MEPPVNFDNLRQITGGDAAMESELFRAFLDSSAACVAGLQAACQSEDEGAWRKHAHAFKGICFNLGAERLGAICRKAQDNSRATADEKQQMLAEMEIELVQVRNVLTKHI